MFIKTAYSKTKKKSFEKITIMLHVTPTIDYYHMLNVE